jgi:hypothetical protein
MPLVCRFTYFASNLHTKKCVDTCVLEKAKTSYILEWREYIIYEGTRYSNFYVLSSSYSFSLRMSPFLFRELWTMDKVLFLQPLKYCSYIVIILMVYHVLSNNSIQLYALLAELIIVWFVFSCSPFWHLINMCRWCAQHAFFMFWDG